MKKYRNYIFDLYGTLVDIHTNEMKSYLWRKMSLWYQMKGAQYSPAQMKGMYHKFLAMEELRKDPEKEIRVNRVFEKMFTDREVTVTETDIVDTAALFRCISIESICLAEGVMPLFEKLKKCGKRIYLMANAQNLYAMPEIKALGLHPYFDGIMLSSDIGVKKPDGDFYLKMLTEFNIKPEASIMIGKDDIEDCHGAAEFGLDSCYIKTPLSPPKQRELPENCRVITNIDEVF